MLANSLSFHALPPWNVARSQPSLDEYSIRKKKRDAGSLHLAFRLPMSAVL